MRDNQHGRRHVKLKNDDTPAATSNLGGGQNTDPQSMDYPHGLPTELLYNWLRR